MTRRLSLAASLVALALLAATMAAAAVASNGQGPAQQAPVVPADEAAEESGSLEFVVTSVIGRALNIPGTY
jgi:hypothetical protein